MIRWFCTAHLSLCITRWSPWKRSSEETLLKWSWSKRDVIRFSVAVVSVLDETQCVGNVHNKLAVGVLMSSTSWPARPSTLVFLFSNHFNINSSAIFVTCMAPQLWYFYSEFCKNGFFSAFFHLPHTCHFETRPSPLSKLFKNAVIIRTFCCSIAKKSTVSLINFYFIAELHAREPYS